MADTFYTIELIDNVSANARKADKQLGRLDKTASRTSKTAKKGSEAFKGFGAATRNLASEQSKAEKAMRSMGRTIDSLTRKEFKRRTAAAIESQRAPGRTDRRGFRDSLRYANTLSRASSGLDRFRRGVTTLFTDPVREAADFGRTIAEISTLTDDATFSTTEIRKATQDAARAWGGDTKSQSKALYDIISAGASESADAISLLDQTNKLAVGGVTDVATAVKPLVSVLNAYGLTARDASKVSDVLFATVKAGITTVPELSSALGRVTTIAGSLGVSFEEVGGFLANMTAKGISTAESVTALRAVLSTFQKPADSAAKSAADLGFNLSSSAFATMSLEEALKDLDARARKRHGTEGFRIASEKIFRNVRALQGVTSSASDNFKGLDKALRITSASAGSTASAVGKIVSQDFFRLELAKTAFQELKIAVGDAALPALTALTDELRTGGTATFKEFGSTIADLVKVLGPTGLGLVVGAGVFAPLLLAGSAMITMTATLGAGLVTVIGFIGGAGVALTALAATITGFVGLRIGEDLAEGFSTTGLGKSIIQSSSAALQGAPGWVRDIAGLDDGKFELTDSALKIMRNPEHGGFEHFEPEEAEEMGFLEKIDQLQSTAPTLGAAAGNALRGAKSNSANKIGSVQVDVHVGGGSSPTDTANAVAEKLDDEISDIFMRHLEGAGA